MLEAEYIQDKINFIDKKFEDSIERFDKVIKMDVDYFKAWHYKGYSLDNLERYEEAIIEMLPLVLVYPL